MLTFVTPEEVRRIVRDEKPQLECDSGSKVYRLPNGARLHWCPDGSYCTFDPAVSNIRIDAA